MHTELNRRANRLAHRLIDLGVHPDARVVLCTDRRPHLVVGLLAILKAGGAYVPLDPSYPAARLEHLIHDADPVLILADRVGRDAIGERPATLALDEPLLDAREADPDVPGLTSAHLAYVLYTSGSTGTPKGVGVPHRAVVNFLISIAREPGMTERDVVLAVTTLSFDIAVLEMLLPLVVGAEIALATREQAHDGGALAGLCIAKRVPALRLFAGSAMYAQATGGDPTGKPSLADVDKQVADLISVL